MKRWIALFGLIAAVCAQTASPLPPATSTTVDVYLAVAMEEAIFNAKAADYKTAFQSDVIGSVAGGAQQVSAATGKVTIIPAGATVGVRVVVQIRLAFTSSTDAQNAFDTIMRLIAARSLKSTAIQQLYSTDKPGATVAIDYIETNPSFVAGAYIPVGFPTSPNVCSASVQERVAYCASLTDVQCANSVRCQSCDLQQYPLGINCVNNQVTKRCECDHATQSKCVPRATGETCLGLSDKKSVGTSACWYVQLKLNKYGGCPAFVEGSGAPPVVNPTATATANPTGIPTNLPNPTGVPSYPTVAECKIDSSTCVTTSSGNTTTCSDGCYPCPFRGENGPRYFCFAQQTSTPCIERISMDYGAYFPTASCPVVGHVNALGRVEGVSAKCVDAVADQVSVTTSPKCENLIALIGSQESAVTSTAPNSASSPFSADTIKTVCANSCIWDVRDSVKRVKDKCNNDNIVGSTSEDAMVYSMLGVMCKKNEKQQYCGETFLQFQQQIGGNGARRALDAQKEITSLLMPHLKRFSLANKMQTPNARFAELKARKQHLAPARFVQLQTSNGTNPNSTLPTATAQPGCQPPKMFKSADGSCKECPMGSGTKEINQGSCRCLPQFQGLDPNACVPCPANTFKPDYGFGMCKLIEPSELPVPSAVPMPSIAMPSIDPAVCAQLQAQLDQYKETMGCCLGEVLNVVVEAAGSGLGEVFGECFKGLTKCTSDPKAKGFFKGKLVLKIKSFRGEMVEKIKVAIARDIAVNLGIDVDRVVIISVSTGTRRALQADSNVNVEYQINGDDSLEEGLEKAKDTLTGLSGSKFDLTNTNSALVADGSSAALEGSPTADAITAGTDSTKTSSTMSLSGSLALLAAALAAAIAF